MNLRPRHLISIVAVAAAVAVAGCGSSNESSGSKLPAASANELSQRLSEIQRRYDDAQQNDNQGACDDIQRDSFPAVSRTIDSLPADVDPKLRDAVSESFANLQQLTDDGCRQIRPKTDTQTTTTEAPPPQTTPTQTAAPETTPTETTPPATTPEKQKKPKVKDNGKGNGNANGKNGGATPNGGSGGGTPAVGQGN